MTGTVGKVYAEALFLLAQEQHQEQKVYEEFNQITDLMLANPELITLLNVPTLETQERIAILQKIIGTQDGITENFLCILIEKHRINKISEIRNDFNALYYEAFRIAEVFVTSAVPLEDSQKEALKTSLQKKLNKTILLKESVDKSLLGGMIVQYGDTRIDNSIKSRIQAFTQQQ